MKIVCAASVLQGREAFSTLGDVVVMPEESIRRKDLLDADLLITRTKLKITRDLLHGTAVRFIGCAVVGTDHIDTAYIEEAGIVWCSAPGCNANSVAEYIVTALLIEAERHNWVLADQTLGVIGVGHIGTRVVEKAMDLGMRVLCSDPPREAVEDDLNGQFVPRDELLAASDMVTLHVPWTHAGPCPTQHMVDYRFFEALGGGKKLFINAARGEVMDSEAVRDALEHGIIRQAVLDVWEHEPRIDKTLLDRVDIGTPHIAGYSVEGRLNGTRMVYEEACHFLETDPVWLESSDDTETGEPEQRINVTGFSDQQTLCAMAVSAYPLPADDRRFREGASADREAMGQHFVNCRRTYPERREFAAARLTVRNISESALNTAWALGFQVCD